MKLTRTIAELRRARANVERRQSVGLVPTMGAFHDGHLSLFRTARAECDAVVVSLFVNPAQFGDHADLDRYPRDEARDLAIAQEEGIDILFAPAADELYPPGFATWVEVGDLGAEGAARPGHFRGVATICLKLFNLVQPDVAYFGQKDAQQVAVLEQMVRDLDLALRLRVAPTIRDRDGLALSSRNVYLSPEERARALALPRALGRARGAADPIAAVRAELNGLAPDYVEIVDLESAKVLAAAARIGATRLIDNVIIEGELR
ncbi:MAG: pantoate--beta-alanine ligase [Gaiellaceae bacterium]